jgi:hypothetical protein
MTTYIKLQTPLAFQILELRNILRKKIDFQDGFTILTMEKLWVFFQRIGLNHESYEIIWHGLSVIMTYLYELHILYNNFF